MRKLLVSLVLSLLLPVSAHAASIFGNAFSVTNTRYGTVPAEARLASNGNDVFLFWISGGSVRVTKLVEGVKRVGRPVLPTTETTIDAFDVLWNGENFFVAATDGINIRGRLLSHDGEPLATDFIVNGNARSPRLAFNGSTILLLHRGVGFQGIGALPLTNHGVAAGGGQAVQLMADEFEVASNGSGFAAMTVSFQHVLLTKFASNGVIAEQETLAGPAFGATREVAIASDGARYLATYLQDQVGGASTLVDSSGHPGTVMSFMSDAQATYESPSATWTGSEYVLAFVSTTPEGASMHALHFNSNGSPTTSDPKQPANELRTATALLPKNGRVLIAWNPREDAVVEELPVEGLSNDWATYGAAEQHLLASTASNAAALVVWNESLNGIASVRFGLRDALGDWSERTLVNRGATRAIAASDGNAFVIVVTEADRTSTAYRVDSRGVVSSRTSTLPFEATGIAWNGQRYGIVGEREAPSQEWANDVVGATFDAAGTLSATTTIRAVDADAATDDPAIASNGQNFLAIWRATDNPVCPFPCIVGTGVEGTRLTGDFTRLDATDLKIAPRDSVVSPPAVVWNGVDYVVVHDNYLMLWTANVTTAGAITSRLLHDTKTRVGDPQLGVLSDGLIAVLFSDNGAPFFGGSSYEPRHRFVMLRSDGTRAYEEDILDGNSPDVRLLVESNRLDYLASKSLLDAPHHGASRVTMRVDVLAGVPFPEPLPPANVTARITLDRERMLIEWNASEFATGYRIEYRVADGSWNEVGVWYDRDTTSTSLVMPDNTAFRVRAFSDKGASAPSTPTSAIRLRFPKRRAVR
jgi:hypothetical protein